jgi:hypothetical protein
MDEVDGRLTELARVGWRWRKTREGFDIAGAEMERSST